MANLKYYIYFFIFYTSVSFGQWTDRNPFGKKVIIENKGQFRLEGKLVINEILFGARQGGLHYYFTKNSIIIKCYKSLVVATGDRAFVNEKIESRFAGIEEFHQINFVGGGIQTEIVPTDKINTVYTFSDENKQSISANAFKKITYKNLYPHINMEFLFPEDKEGFKYNLILEPGSDISQIKINYPLASSMKLDNDGNLIISSRFGDFIDHAPLSYQTNNGEIDSHFNLLDNTISFNLPFYKNTKQTIIDPWTSVPNITTGNNTYDVDFDNTGNCYAYGGNFPFQLVKFDPNGVQQWNYTTGFNQLCNMYGDFTLDRNLGTCYIGEGNNNNTGAQIEKIDSFGSLITTWTGHVLLGEIWRMAFDYCNNRAVFAGGGTTRPSAHICILDTALANMQPAFVFDSLPDTDIWGLSLDISGNCYMGVARIYLGSVSSDNKLYKASLSSLSALNSSIWSQPSGYGFQEVSSVGYYDVTQQPSNGYNGMTTNGDNLFTYDSYVLKKWNANNGTLIDSAIVNGPTQFYMYWGGLVSNQCGDLFLGSRNSVVHYDANLNFISSYAMPDSVYDVNLSDNGFLYVSGKGFVSSLNVGTLSCSPCGYPLNIYENIAKEYVRIYPNPSNGVFNIVTENIQVRYVSVFDLLGNIVYANNKINLDLSHLANGVYFATVSLENNTSYKEKIMINR